MQVLVTGVAGRIGSELARALLRDGHDVRGTVRPGGRSLEPPLSAEVDVVEASLTDFAALTRAVADVDVVVHLAAQMALGDTPIEEYFDINVLGTQRLLEACAHRDTPLRRFVLASTDGTYGPTDPHPEPITEQHPQLPGDYYGTSKVLCEQLVRNYGILHDLDHTILRFGSVVTPREAATLFSLDWTRAFLGQAEAGRRGSLWRLFQHCPDPVGLLDTAVGDHDGTTAVALTGPDGGSWSLHLTDVRDAVAGTMLAIQHPGAANEVFNIVADRTTTFAEGAAAIARHFGVASVTVRMPMTLDFELAIAKARDVLGYRPPWDFTGMVSTAVADGAGTTTIQS